MTLQPLNILILTFLLAATIHADPVQIDGVDAYSLTHTVKAIDASGKERELHKDRDVQLFINGIYVHPTQRGLGRSFRQGKNVVTVKLTDRVGADFKPETLTLTFSEVVGEKRHYRDIVLNMKGAREATREFEVKKFDFKPSWEKAKSLESVSKRDRETIAKHMKDYFALIKDAENVMANLDSIYTLEKYVRRDSLALGGKEKISSYLLKRFHAVAWTWNMESDTGGFHPHMKISISDYLDFKINKTNPRILNVTAKAGAPLLEYEAGESREKIAMTYKSYAMNFIFINGVWQIYY